MKDIQKSKLSVDKINQLQAFLNQNDIPVIKGKPKTFLGIAKQPHYENVLSNLLAFYFNVNEVHRLKDLFVSSLLECIAKSKLCKEKEALQTFYDFDIDTEYTTNKGGRIDLLLHNKDQAIIIENKVYHHLNNDLFDYWNTVKISTNNDANKIGVILSLRPVSDISHSHFINITHIDLLQTVMKNCGAYLLEANSKYVTFLKDLYQNIMNLSKPNMEEKDLKFYFDNKTKIDQVAKFKFAVRAHVMSEVETAGMILDDVNLYSPRKASVLSKRVRYFQSKIDKNLMIVVVFEDVMDKNRIFLGVEFKDGCLKNRERYKNIEFTEAENDMISKTNFFMNTNSHWAHFAGDYYPVNETDVSQLSTFIVSKLKEKSLLSIFNKLNSFLEAKN